MNLNDIADFNKKQNPIKVQQNIQNKYNQYLANQATKERKVVQVDGHNFLKKSPSKEHLDKVQIITVRKKVGNIYEDIEDMVDRRLSDDEDQNEMKQKSNQLENEEDYIQSERKQLKKKIQQFTQRQINKQQEENETQQRKLEIERLKKLKKDLEENQIELKCFCKQIGSRVVKQCDSCKDLKKIKQLK